MALSLLLAAGVTLTDAPALASPPPLLDTVQVAAPTGRPGTDRPNVQAAFDHVQPGDTVMFAPGMYVLAEGARLTVPDVTVLGHPDGTVLRGCEPERFDLPEGHIMELIPPLALGCTGLWVHADRQTIRGLTFDHTWHGIHSGPWIDPTSPAGAGPPEPGFGGHRIEGNVFRNVPNGIRVVGPTDAPTVIRDNEVENAYHAFQGNGAPVHVVDNRVTVSEPASVPASHYPESGVILSAGPTPSCEASRVVGNVIEGTVHGIQVLATADGRCRDIEIRDNVIRVRTVPLPSGYPPHLLESYFSQGATGSAVAGIAIRLYGGRMTRAESADGATITDVLIQENRILGGEGLGIQLVNAAANSVVGNHIASIRRRAPFPGLTWGDDPERWRDANGSGIWISEGSDENVVEGNTFLDIEGSAVHVAGEGNEIRLSDPGSAVRDVGRDNRVVTSTGEDEAAVLAVVDAALERVSAEDMPGLTDLMLPGAAIGAVGSREGRPFHRMRSRDEERATPLPGDVVERGFDAEVRLSGPLAMAWVPYDLYIDGAWSHCGVDVFTLFRTDAGWRIASLTYSVEQPPACRRHPDGPPGGG